MAKDRQAKRRLGDEDVAGHHFERGAGRVDGVLVVAGGDHAGVLAGHRDLRRAQHVARRMEFDFDVAEPNFLAIAHRLCAAGEIVAVAQLHHVERFLRGEHGAMAGPGMVGMAVGNHGALDRTDRVDMEAARFAAEAGRSGDQDVLRTHAFYIGGLLAMFSRVMFGSHARA